MIISKHIRRGGGGGKIAAFLAAASCFTASAEPTTLADSDADCIVSGEVALDHDTTIDGTLYLASANVNLNGHKLYVKGLADGNIVENGSFETFDRSKLYHNTSFDFYCSDPNTPATDGYLTEGESVGYVQGWTFTAATGAAKGLISSKTKNTFVASGATLDGTYAFVFQSLQKKDGVQTLSTPINVPLAGTYNVSFKYGARNGAVNGRLVLSIGGEQVADVTATKTATTTATAQIELEAGATELVFTHYNTTADKQSHTWVDDVRVTGASSVTDTSDGAPGELHLEIAGGTHENATIALSGNLKLVKKGAGTLLSSKAQTYTGGTLVAGGVAMPPNGSNGKSKTGDNFKAFGTGRIVVSEGATFDVNGEYGYRNTVDLDGGTFTSTGAAMTYVDYAGSGVGRLTKPSYLVVKTNLVFGEGDATDLNGQTLYVTLDGNGHFIPKTPMTNGTIVARLGENATNNGRQLQIRSGWDMRDATLDAACVVTFAVSASHTLKLGGYISRTDRSYSNYAGTMEVYGFFKPVTEIFYGCKLMDGATLDLSARTGAWSTVSASAEGDAKKEVEFAPSATIKVAFGERGDLKEIMSRKVEGASAGYVVKWTTAPDASVQFVFADDSLKSKYKLAKTDEGLLLLPAPGFVLFVR